MKDIDTASIIEAGKWMLAKDGPYKSLNASPFLSVCHVLGVEPDRESRQLIPDCREAIKAILRLAVAVERGRQ